MIHPLLKSLKDFIFLFIFLSLNLISSSTTAQTVVLDTNGKTIKYTGTTISNNRFIQANLRGSVEFFCVVDDSTKDYITDYSRGVQAAIDFFTPEGETSPVPFDNIVTTLITDMSNLFDSRSNFNSEIGSWDVSKTTSMADMFKNAINFNQDLSLWDVSAVIDMTKMFYNAISFNQNINSWNVSNVTNMNLMFAGTSAFDQPLNAWNVSNVSNMFGMFNRSIFNQPIGNWDVSNVTDMSYMFYGATSFNQFIDNWDVSNVTNIGYMFYQAESFNQPIGSWNVSIVINMYFMFYGATSFNQPIGNWDVSNVTDMSYMFYGATSFNQSIDNWNVSNVTNMGYMFYQAQSFNQPIGSWNVSIVINMYFMFYGATSFNQPIGNWDVSNVTDMSYMFYGATSFNQFIDNWDVSNVTNMGYMFYQAESFNQPIGSWNVSIVINMYFMFYGATSFNQPIGNWDVSNVTNMGYMFYQAESFNQPIGSWNVSIVINMYFMFYGATSFNQPIGNWDVSNVTDMSYMFYGATSFNQPIGSWNVSLVINMYFMFYGTNYSSSNYDNLLQGWSQLTLQSGVVFDIPNTNYCTSTVARQLIIDNFGWIISDEGYESCFTPITNTNFKEAINTCLSTNPIDGMCSDSEYGVMPNWDVSQVTDMSNAFQDRDNFNVDISAWDVRNVNSMRQTFKGANSFNKDISNWNTSSVNDFYGMFSSASSFNQDIGSWVVSSATNMSELFRLAISFNQDLNSWNVSNVTTFSGTFAQSSVFNGNISSWNVSNCSNFGGMFYENPAFSGDISSWNVSTAQDMSSMFHGAVNFNSDISSWNVSSVITMSRMFQGATIFNKSLNNWNVSNVSNMHRIFMHARSFNQNLNNWDISNATDVYGLFDGAHAFNGNVDTWIFGSVDIGGMFYDTPAFNQDISNWDVSEVIGMDGLFNGSSFNQDISGWCVTNIVSEPSNFSTNSPLTESNKPVWGTCPVNVVDTTLPVITITGDATVTIEVGSIYTDPGATATDNYDGDITSSIVTVNPVDTDVVEQYIITYNVSDANNNAAVEVTRTVNVVDTTVPVITLTGDATVTIEVGSTYTDAGATAIDNYDGDITSSIVTVNTVDTSIVGTYTVTYDVSDANNNDAVQVIRTVNVVDTTLPVITITGDATVTIEVGSIYTDPGATATDNYDGDITSSIVTVNPVDTDVVEQYIITYNVSDANNNAAVEVTRTVNVVDTTVPVITLTGDATVTIEVGSTYTDAGATATDNYDGDITSSIVTVNPVDTDVVEQYIITYNVSDANNNAAVEVTRTVNVVDTTVPVITLTGDATVTIEVGSTYTDAGATAIDNYDGDITSSIVTVNTVDTSIVGTYTVTYDVSDANNNDAVQVIRTVNVVDTTLPVITITGDATVTIEVGSIYTDPGATATDNYDGDITSSIVTVNPVDTDVVGQYTVTYNVSDANNNAAVAVTRTVNVESSLSIEENTNYKLKIYPNPVDDKLTIQGLQKEVKVSIYNVLGKLVLSKTTLSEIDVYNLKSGSYFIKIKNNQKVVIRRFIKN